MTQVQTPPPPPAANAYSPSPPVAAVDAKSSMGRTVALWVLFAFLVLIVLPIFALRVLGTVVEVDDASDYPVESVSAPVDSTQYLATDGSFTMAIDPSWGQPIIEPNVVTGRDAASWFMPEHSTAEFSTNVNVSSVLNDPLVTLEMLSGAELALAQSQLDEVSNVQERTRNLDGDLVREFSFTGSIQGIELAWYAVIHKEGNLVHMATVTTSAELADQVRAESEPYLLTIRSLN